MQLVEAQKIEEIYNIITNFKMEEKEKREEDVEGLLIDANSTIEECCVNIIL